MVGLLNQNHIKLAFGLMVKIRLEIFDCLEYGEIILISGGDHVRHKKGKLNRGRT